MKYCSLGDNCNPAIILQELGLKSESYPFDWLNSRSEIVKLCIKDDFKTFLDRSLYSPLINTWEDGDNICQHDIYSPLLNNYFNFDNPVFFRHRDPFTIDEDYKYYVRCVDRFRKLLASDEEKVFVKSYMDRTPEEHYLEDAIALTKFLELYTTNFKVIAIKHSVTGSQSLHIEEQGNLKYAEITSMYETDGAMLRIEPDISFIISLFNHLKQN